MTRTGVIVIGVVVLLVCGGIGWWAWPTSSEEASSQPAETQAVAKNQPPFLPVLHSSVSASSTTPVDQRGNSQVARTKSPVIGGYYVNTSILPIEKIPYEKYTHLFHAFLTFDASGKLLKRKNMPSKTLTRLAHRQGTKVVLSLGGGGWKHFPAVLETPAKRNAFVRAVITLIDQYDYDGVDLDWEYPRNAVQKKQWAELVRVFREELTVLEKRRDQPYLLTAAVTATDWVGKWIDVDAVRQYMDFLNVMTYDFCGYWGGKAGNHSPLYLGSNKPAMSMSDCMDYWHKKRGIPKEKLVFGLPFYSFAFHKYKPGDKINPKDKPRRVYAWPWSKTAQVMARPGWKASRDPASKGLNVQSPDGQWFTVADDPITTAYKTRWAQSAGYRGVFYWAMHHDVMPDGRMPLLEAMTTVWPRKP